MNKKIKIVDIPLDIWIRQELYIITFFVVVLIFFLNLRKQFLSHGPPISAPNSLQRKQNATFSQSIHDDC